MRVGFGYDVHRLVENRKLILGGVEIEHSLGLLGHSDADVLIHALMDSLLGAAALSDIGTHFPDTDERYRGISSIKLLKCTCQLIREKGYEIENCDITVAMQKPKIKPYIDAMRENLANAMEIDKDKVSIKATTEEGLGFTGEMLGVKAYAVCLIERRKNENL